MSPDTAAVAYVENRFGPNWRQVLAFYDFVVPFRDDHDLSEQIRDVYYSDRSAFEGHSLAGLYKLVPEGTPRHVHQQMRRASDAECPAIGYATFATASVAAAFAARPYMTAESFNLLTRPFRETLGDQWTGFLAGLEPMPPVDTQAETEANR
jgi:hypothetical protein